VKTLSRECEIPSALIRLVHVMPSEEYAHLLRAVYQVIGAGGPDLQVLTAYAPYVPYHVF
jgi:hypothetical protein